MATVVPDRKKIYMLPEVIMLIVGEIESDSMLYKQFNRTMPPRLLDKAQSTTFNLFFNSINGQISISGLSFEKISNTDHWVVYIRGTESPLY